MERVLLVILAACLVVAQAQALEPLKIDNVTTDVSSSYSNRIGTRAVDGNFTTHWLSAGNATSSAVKDPTPYITFIFDGLYTIDQMFVANCWESGSDNWRGIYKVDIYILKTDTNPLDYAGYTYWGPLYFDIAPKGSEYPPFQVFDELRGVEAKAVKFDILSNWASQRGQAVGNFDRDTPPPTEGPDGNVNANNSFVGVTDVYFTQVVPEPATMTLLALGGLALLRRGRHG